MKEGNVKKQQDMGTGSIPKLLAQLAIPAVVAQIINLLYNIVDRIYIGHMPEVGANALTGVGLFLPINMEKCALLRPLSPETLDITCRVCYILPGQ